MIYHAHRYHTPTSPRNPQNKLYSGFGGVKAQRANQNLKPPTNHCTLILKLMKSLIPSSRKHDLVFHSDGRIDISAKIARVLSLNPGDIIGISEEQGEWFLHVRLRAGCYSGRHDGKVFPTARGRGTWRTQSVKMTSAILKASSSAGPLRLPCGQPIIRDNNKYITIIHHIKL